MNVSLGANINTTFWKTTDTRLLTGSLTILLVNVFVCESKGWPGLNWRSSLESVCFWKTFYFSCMRLLGPKPAWFFSFLTGPKLIQHMVFQAQKWWRNTLRYSSKAGMRVNHQKACLLPFLLGLGTLQF